MWKYCYYGDKQNQHNTALPDGLKQHYSEMSTDNNNNFISASPKDKLVSNASPKGNKSKVLQKQISGRCQCVSTVNIVKKKKTILLYLTV